MDEATAGPVRGADVDHLVLGVPLLREGMDGVEELLGTRPVPGGRHPAFGTHNALVSLSAGGAATYLEVIAPDPGLEPPAGGRAFGVEGLGGPRLLTWAVRVPSLDVLAEDGTLARIGLGEIQSGRRQRPDGTVLTWRLTDPYARPLDGTVPFLIDWGDTPHPSASAPQAGELAGLRIHHPEPGRVLEALEALGVTVEVVRGPFPGLVATVRTPTGAVELR